MVIPFMMPSIIIEDELSNFLSVIQFSGRGDFNFQEMGVQNIKIEDTETVTKIQSDTSLSAGTSKSLHLFSSNADFQTTNTAKVIILVEGSATTLTDFEIIEDSSADAGTGTPKEDFSSVSIGGNNYITSSILSFAASKFITIKVTTGTISSVSAFVIE